MITCENIDRMIAETDALVGMSVASSQCEQAEDDLITALIAQYGIDESANRWANSIDDGPAVAVARARCADAMKALAKAHRLAKLVTA